MRPKTGALIGVAAAILVAAALGFALLPATPMNRSSQQPPTSTEATASTTPESSSVTATSCCVGRFVVKSISLTTSALTFTLTNDGYFNFSSIVPRFAGREITQVQGLLVGQTSTYVIPIPSWLHLVVGQTYKTEIGSTIGGSPGDGRASGGAISEFNLTVKSSSSTSSPCAVITSGATGQNVTSSCSTFSYECSSTGGPVGIYVQVLSDAGRPLPNASLSGYVISYCGVAERDTYLGPYLTNATGWAFIPGSLGFPFVTLTYAGNNYSIPGSAEDTYTTYITYKVPSGTMTELLCVGATKQSCHS